MKESGLRKKSKSKNQNTNEHTSKRGDPERPKAIEAPWFAKAPNLSDEARARINGTVELSLLDLLEGDTSLMVDVLPAGIGISTFGLTADRHHYLPDNRLLWWETFFDTDLKTEAIVGDEEFICSFNPVVGSILDWEDVPFGHPAHHKAGTEFIIRSASPNYTVLTETLEVIPDVIDFPVQITNVPEFHQVLVHKPLVGFDPDPDEQQPAVLIIFNEPQRAVGVSYGLRLDGDGNEVLNARRIILVGYDIDGRERVRSEGRNVLSGRVEDHVLRFNAVHNHIGVTHESAEIAYLELYLEHAEDFPNAPLLIYRVWHEAFPAAAVHQGFIDIKGQQGAGSQRVQEKISLPFRCDRAVAVSRGIRAEFLDGPAEIRTLSSNISIGRFPDGWHLTADGFLRGEDGPPWRIRLYYSVLAWESSKMEVYNSYGFGQSEGRIRNTGPQYEWVENESYDEEAWLRGEVPQGPERYYRPISGVNFAPDQIRAFANDPCPRDVAECGEFVGLLSGFGFRMQQSSEMDSFRITSGESRRLAPSRNGTRAVSFTTEFVARAERILNHRSIRFQVLAGTGVRPGRQLEVLGYGLTAAPPDPSDEVGVVDDGTVDIVAPCGGPRPFNTPPGSYERFGDSRGNPVDPALTMSADMAMLGMKTIGFAPGGKIRQVDAEALGTQYDGAKMQYVWAIGVSSEEEQDDPDECHDYRFVPQTVGVTRKLGVTPIHRLSTQGLLFEDAVKDVLSLEPARFGAIKNDGNRPVELAGVSVSGAHSGDFSLVAGIIPRVPIRRRYAFRNLRQAGEVFNLYDFASRAPVQIGPGETLLVGGACLPQDEGSREMTLLFSTNDRLRPQVSIDVLASVVASQADAEVIPEEIDFGNVSVDSTRSRHAYVLSTGHSALLVNNASFAGNHDGFNFEIVGEHFEPGTPDQVEPGAIWPDGGLTVTFTPENQADYEAEFKIETDAGMITIPMTGKGVSA